MELYIFIVFVAVVATLFDFKKDTGGLKIAFVIITVFLGLRYMYGSDYPAYLELFRQYNSDGIPFWDIRGIMQSDVYGELGWQILNKMFKPFGYFGLNIALAIFENVVIYKMVKGYVPSQWYWLAIVVYMLNSRLFLIGACSMERQWLAMSVFILAIKFIEEKRFVPYVLMVIIAGLFHKSAFLMLPFYFLSYVKNLNFKIFHVVIFVLLLFVWNTIVPLLMEPLMNDFVVADEIIFSDYARFADRESVNEQFTIIGLISEVIVTYVVPLLGLLYFSHVNSKTQKLILLYVVALFIKPFAEIIPMINRFDYYFIIFSICLIPLLFSLLSNSKHKLLSYGLAIMVVAIYLRQTYGFLTAGSWVNSYIYKSILFQPWV